MNDKASAAADLLASLALAGKTIEQLPEQLRPASEADAMEVQRAFFSRHPSAGWKVGGHPSGHGWAGAPLRGAPLNTPAILTAANAATMQIEVEIALVLGRDLSATASAGEVRAAIGSAHLAFELFRSSYADRAAQDVPSVMADHFNNAGIVLGSGRALSEADDLTALAVLLHRDDVEIGRSTAGPSLDLIVESVCWLATYAAALGAPLKPGDAILTGARIGPLGVREPGEYVGMSALGAVNLRVV